MKIMELTDYIQQQTPIPFFPLAFPLVEDAPIEAGVVQFMTSYTTAKAGTQKVNIQMIVRADHPETAEGYALDLVNHFDNRTDFIVGTTRVILCNLRTPFPLFVGKDNGGHYRYSINMNFLVDKEKGG